ncbi:hypothetical protein ABS768_01770 [Flavobacterium sp. ST-75]|uniref:HTTM-like domain-containing protein n=1 Tax=Flavobacterium rhizophilum TaxID=3163296 RepID=A0ABW8YA54_9FLAO
MLKLLNLKATPRSFNISNFFFGNSVTNHEFLVFFRVTIGFIILGHFLAVLGDFDLLFGMNSLIPADIHSVQMYSKIVFYNEIIDFITLYTKSEGLSVTIFQVTYILLCILIIVGFFSRIAAILLVFLQVSLMKSSFYFCYGADFFTSMSLMYIALFPSDDYFSIRNYFWKIKEKSNLTPFRRLFQIHICIAYFVSGFEKITGYNWRNGESVWKAIHLPGFPNDFHLNFDSLGNYPWIFVLAGWFTILVEMLYPLFINIRRTRMIWLCLTISLHLGIALVLNLYFFSAILITWNIANYYFNDEKKVALA